MRPAVGIIHYDIGNLRSVEKALRHVGAATRWVRGPADLAGLKGLVLPGVGAFGDCMKSFEKTGLRASVLEWIAADRPFFGICVGYQMLFEGSEESPGVPGLGVFKGRVVRFPSGPLKVPQMGWNTVMTQKQHPLLSKFKGERYVYFVHSYFPKPEDPGIVTLSTTYGVSFASAAGRGKLFATQFHPEKSQEAGLELLGAFVELCS